MGNCQNSNNINTPVCTDIVVDVCTICLQDLRPRGGIPLTNPGCCGKWYHQSCVEQMVLAGNSSCPNCRATFQNVMNPTATVGFPIVPTIPPSTQAALSSFLSPPPRASASFSNVEDLIDESSLNANIRVERSDPGHSKVFLECVPELSEVSLQEQSDFYVNISMKAVSENSMTKRLPMDLVCILDNSGSMSGAKLESVKEAITFIRSQLNSDDRLSLVIFNSDAFVVHGLMKMSDEKKTLSSSRLTSVVAEGGTNIYSGMTSAMSILETRKTRNPISCVFLLTDGQDSSRVTDKIALARQMKANGHSLFVFGFGNDHDADQLQSIAGAAEAPFTFIEADSMVIDAFGGALGGQQGIMGKDIRLSVKAAAGATDTVKVLKMYSGRYSNQIASDGRSGEVQFANIFVGEHRDILVKIHIPAVPRPVDVYSLLSASVSYHTVDGTPMQGIPVGRMEGGDALCSVSRVLDASKAEADVKVDAQKNRVLVTEALNASMALADSSDYSSAKTEIKRVRGIVMNSKSSATKEALCEALIEQLDEACEKVDNATEFRSRGGKAHMCELGNTLAGQRSMYRKSTSKSPFSYQSPSSVTAQRISSNSKSR